jgi:hypothetical protein
VSSPSPTSVPPVTASPLPPPGIEPCATRSLSASIGLSQGAAGSIYTNIDLTNISNLTCTLYGYPGVALAGGTPVSQIGAAATENPATPRQVVTLAPGAVANALLRIVQAADYPASRCQPAKATYLQIIPPNQSTPIYLGYDATGCTGSINLLTVDVVQPGSGG